VGVWEKTKQYVRVCECTKNIFYLKKFFFRSGKNKQKINDLISEKNESMPE
jgi:hypothetical protein